MTGVMFATVPGAATTPDTAQLPTPTPITGGGNVAPDAGMGRIVEVKHGHAYPTSCTTSQVKLPTLQWSQTGSAVGVPFFTSGTVDEVVPV